jgi:hypothetical protein
MNNCDQHVRTTRGIIFVPPCEKSWTNDEIMQGIGSKIKESFNTQTLVEED